MSDSYYDDEDGNYYCYECYHKDGIQAIRSYNYKPSPVFHGMENRYFGVELEVDNGGHSKKNAQMILGIANEEFTNSVTRSASKTAGKADKNAA